MKNFVFFLLHFIALSIYYWLPNHIREAGSTINANLVHLLYYGGEGVLNIIYNQILIRYPIIGNSEKAKLERLMAHGYCLFILLRVLVWTDYYFTPQDIHPLFSLRLITLFFFIITGTVFSWPLIFVADSPVKRLFKKAYYYYLTSIFGEKSLMIKNSKKRFVMQKQLDYF